MRSLSLQLQPGWRVSGGMHGERLHTAARDFPRSPAAARTEQGKPYCGARAYLFAGPAGLREGPHVILKLRWNWFLACHSGLVRPGANGQFAGQSPQRERPCVWVGGA